MKDSWYFILQGDFEKAISSVDPSISGEREAVKSSIAEKEGDYKSALQLAEETVDAGHPQAYVLVAYAYWRMGQYSQAEYWAHRATESTPAKAYNLLALIEWSKGKKENSSERYKRALELLQHSRKMWGDPIGMSYFHNNTGNILLSLGRVKVAEMHYFHALALRRQTRTRALVGTTLRDLGRLYKVTGRSKMARSYFLQSLELRRKLNNAHDIAKTLLSLVEVDESKELRDELVLLYGKVRDVVLKRIIRSFL